MGRLFSILILVLFVNVESSAFNESEVNNLVKRMYNQYGDQRVACPSVKIVETNEMVAAYLPGTNEIWVEQTALDICQTYGEDYEAALAFILGHELSHALQQHDHVHETSFFAYDSKHSDNPKYILSQREREADLHGAFGVFLLGKDVSKVFPDIIDDIYEEYGLTDRALINYPPKLYRKSIAKKVLKQVDSLATIYDLGNSLSILGKYPEAKACFDYIAGNYQGIEIYNAKATNLILEAINFSTESIDQYLYPIELDFNTRLHKARKAGGVKDLNPLEMKHRYNLLEEALNILNESYQKNNTYVPTITNLLICYNLLGNYEVALDEFDQLTNHLNIEDGDFPQLQLVKAITFLNSKQHEEGMLLLKKIEDVNDPRIVELAKLNIMRFDDNTDRSSELMSIDKLPSEISLAAAESFANSSEVDLSLSGVSISYQKPSESMTLYKVQYGSKSFILQKGRQRISTTVTYPPVAYSESGSIYSVQFDKGALTWNDLTGDYTLLIE